MAKSVSISLEQYLYKQTYESGFVSYLVRIRKLHVDGEWRKRVRTLKEAQEFKAWCMEQRELNKVEPKKKKNNKTYSDKPGLIGWGGLRAEA